jgi:hypothetical protein
MATLKHRIRFPPTQMDSALLTVVCSVFIEIRIICGIKVIVYRRYTSNISVLHEISMRL